MSRRLELELMMGIIKLSEKKQK